jgi:hypothetical protein
MYRFRLMISTAFVAGMISGCGEDQPNAPAQPNEVNADFAKKTADMMKAANSSIDPKKAKLPPAPPAP